MDYHFGKTEKLKRKTYLDALFSKGKSLKRFPVKLIYHPIETPNHKIGVSVPKRSFKRAVDRNRLKRLLRESYRLNKALIDGHSKGYALMFIYIGKEKTDFATIYSTVEKLLNEFTKKIKS